ncbi:MAG TPA: hypothetical protein ENJ90_00245 [Devosia sp.]|nr:hypothetical protein [Devosia sp.]
MVTMPVLARQIYERADYLVRANPLLIEIINRAEKAAPAKTKGVEWAPKEPKIKIEEGPAVRTFLNIGLANILTLRFLDRNADKLVLVRQNTILAAAPESVLDPSENFEGIADFDFFDTERPVPGYEPNTVAREHLDFLGKSHGKIYRFLSMPEWSLNTLEIANDLPAAIVHGQAQLALDLSNFPDDGHIVSALDFRNHPDERFARALKFIWPRKHPVKKAELAKYLDLSVENDAIAIIWDKLKLVGANIHKQGRPRK